VIGGEPLAGEADSVGRTRLFAAQQQVEGGDEFVEPLVPLPGCVLQLAKNAGVKTGAA